MSRVDRVKKSMSERSGSNFLPFHKFADGKSDIRILPAQKGADAEDWFTAVGVHYNIDSSKPLTCPYETYWAEERCPVCELVAELRGSGEQEDVQKMSVRRSYFVRGSYPGSAKPNE